MATKTGIKCKAYRNTGSWGSPTWSEVKCLSDLSQNVAWDKVDAVTRESLVKLFEKTMLDLNWTGKVQKGNVGDATNLAALLAAVASQSTIVDMMILDGASTANGTVGFRGEMKIFTANESQNPGDVLYSELLFAFSPPSVAGQIPQSVLVSSGAPVLTDLAP